MQEESIYIDLKSRVQLIQAATVSYETVMTPDFLESYHTALSFSKLKLQDELRYRNVLIHEDQHIHEIYTVSPSHLPHLVMLHGFGGTSLTFIRLFQQLKDDFQIHALDTFGVGLSSRGKWKNDLKQEQIIAYFVDSLEQWRKNVKIDKFILLGHSFGGYIASFYYGAYPQHVSRLFFLSPVGSGHMTKERIQQHFSDKRFFFCFGSIMFSFNFRPSRIMNAFCIGSFFTERLLSTRLKLAEEQKQAWKDYLKKINQIENSSELAFYKLFEWPLQPCRSIDETIRSVPQKTKTHFLFGDIDWMNREGVDKLVQDFNHIDLHIIPEAGHQIIFDNPSGVANKIIQLCRRN